MSTEIYDFDVVVWATRLQAVVWLMSAVFATYVVGKKNWAQVCTPLRLGVGLWIGSCVAQSLTFVSHIVYMPMTLLELVTPFLTPISGALVVWFVHDALLELNNPRNRRASKLLKPSLVRFK